MRWPSRTGTPPSTSWKSSLGTGSGFSSSLYFVRAPCTKGPAERGRGVRERQRQEGREEGRERERESERKRDRERKRANEMENEGT